MAISTALSAASASWCLQHTDTLTEHRTAVWLPLQLKFRFEVEKYVIQIISITVRQHSKELSEYWQHFGLNITSDKVFCHRLFNFAHSCFVWSFIWAKSCPHQKDEKMRFGSVSCRAGWWGVRKKKRLKLRCWDNVSEVPSSEPFIYSGLPVLGARETLR